MNLFVLDIKMITTNLTPTNLYISESEFNNLVSIAEQEWEHDNNQNPKHKEPFVQYWIRVSPEFVDPDYILQLKYSYINAGWRTVNVEWVEDRTTSLMVFLSMNK